MTQPAPLHLHWFALSGHSHRAQLGAALLGVPVELIAVDLKNNAHKRAEFLSMNRFGQVPVLEHGGFTLADSNAMALPRFVPMQRSPVQS
ncbi:MAG: glutathione S-transferase N-terminal domain-containing protein [Pseudomonadota bacterium]